MTTLLGRMALAGFLGVLGAASAQAQPADSARVYTLSSPSSFETGCFGPCACPVLSRAIGGTFVLQHTGFDGLFDHYDVRDVRWSAPETTSPLQITGSGTYRVGGEVAVQQQMILDLTVNGGPVRHFDSGLVSGNNQFPKIDISVSLHQNTACFDTVIHVVAGPTSVIGVPGEFETRVMVEPNPFRAAHGTARIEIELAAPARVTAVLFDGAGRRVRDVVPGLELGAGPHAFAWDGRRDQGERLAPGVYFLRVAAGRFEITRAVVLLR